jgi:hypothetical protein
VQYLHWLWSGYPFNLSGNALARLRTAKDDRVKLPQTETYMAVGGIWCLGRGGSCTDSGENYCDDLQDFPKTDDVRTGTCIETSSR